ncbi:hypothetical protein G6045_10445 [Streptomyces sp. YC504]|uniref:FlgD Ig-like domain-containing protein n=1 Tax=Streptomyces mesophilus TaxID=1775132 RepID=A0A6G4XFB4_9ACTN|nr:FG-GAP-like repeat-containing protein [Streptomyces mesophilus]NGO76088.1 hypothetical protein [Streptomyces mesophilus]
MRTTPAFGSLMGAGSTGFLHGSTALGGYGKVDWTTYDGKTHRVEGLTNGFRVDSYGAASDVIAVPPKAGQRAVALTDMASGRSWTVTLPEGLNYEMTVGETVVAVRPGTGSLYSEVHLLQAENGATVDRKVTGLPEGAIISDVGGASTGLLLDWAVGSSLTQYAWVDLANGHLEVLPFKYQPALTSRHFVTSARDESGATRTEIYAQGRWDVPVHTLPKLYIGTDTKVLGVVDKALIVARYDAAYGAKVYYGAQWRISAVPFDGSPEREIIARAVADRVAHRPDGGLILMGGAGSEDYGYTAVVADASGGVRTELLHRIPPKPMAVQGLMLDQGRLSTIEYGDSRAAVYTRELTEQVPGFGARTDRGEPAGTTCRDSASACPTLVPTGDGRTVYRGLDAQNREALFVVDGGNDYPGKSVPLDLGEAANYAPRVRAASGDLALVQRDNTIGSPQTYIVDIDDGRTLHKEALTPSALWGDTLWTAVGQGTGGKLSITAKNARTGAQQATLTVGSDCGGAADLQVVGRWLYWKCWTGTAPNAAAGVVDLATGKNVPIPRVDGTAVLGDGFVVEGGAQVDRYDVRSGTAVVQSLGQGGAPVVDPRTGDFAFRAWRAESGDWSEVRVIRGQQTAADLVSTHSRVTPTVDTDATPVPWQAEWWLTEPALAPTVTFKAKSTGKTVATVTGKAGTHSVTAAWDGKGTGGALLPNGTYIWSLSAQPADGAGPALTKTGTVRLSGGTAVRRDHAGTTARPDGIGDLLTLNSSGGLTFQHGTGSGTFSGKTSGSGWPTSTFAVPFGDLNGDRCNDVLVRMPDGRMRAYTPACGAALQPTTQHKVLGTGWNMHNVLTAAGDLTGDGRPDLVARKAATGELFVYRGTASGTVGSPLRVGSGWGVYTHITGAGDLNGDGRADLLARHTDGTLYRYDGLGNGLFAPRAKVFTNWGGSYNALIGAGDITGDGKADLVVRDKAGNLYRNTGDGKGSFSGRTQIATGWGVYKGVF